MQPVGPLGVHCLAGNAARPPVGPCAAVNRAVTDIFQSRPAADPAQKKTTNDRRSGKASLPRKSVTADASAEQIGGECINLDTVPDPACRHLPMSNRSANRKRTACQVQPPAAKQHLFQNGAPAGARIKPEMTPAEGGKTASPWQCRCSDRSQPTARCTEQWTDPPMVSRTTLRSDAAARTTTNTLRNCPVTLRKHGVLAAPLLRHRVIDDC